MGFYFDSFLLDMLLAFVIAITMLIFYSKYHYQYWKRNKIAQLNPKFPFGDCKSIMLRQESLSMSFCDIYKQFKKQNVPYGGYYFTNRPELMILDPDIIKKILVKDFQHFTDRGTFCDEEHDPLTGHLFSLDGDKWKNLRAKLTPTFTSGKMKMMFQTLVSCSDELDNVLSKIVMKSEPLDIRDISARFTTDVIGSCAFGIECNSLKNPNTDFRTYGQQIFEPKSVIDRYKGLGSFLFPKFFKFFGIKAINADLTNFFMGVVKSTVQYREENNIDRKDFMQLLLQIKNHEELGNGIHENNSNHTSNGKTRLTMNQIAAQCFVFFVAGFDTSATTMTFCLYELAKNQEIQEKAREEINAMLEKHEGKMTYEGMMEMHYLEKVINETLRKYPPLAFLIRECTSDYPLPNSNYIIRKGQMIRISSLGLQRDPDYYPDPEKFDPERFSEEVKSKRHPLTFIPFGEGPRICIGLRFGLMQTKVGLSALLKKYKFTINNKTTEPLFMEPNNLILSARDGIWLNAQKI